MIVHVIAMPWNRGSVHQTIAQVHIKNKRFIIQPISKHNLLLKRRFMHMLQLMVNSHCIESTKGIHATKQWFTSREL